MKKYFLLLVFFILAGCNPATTIQSKTPTSPIYKNTPQLPTLSFSATTESTHTPVPQLTSTPAPADYFELPVNAAPISTPVSKLYPNYNLYQSPDGQWQFSSKSWDEPVRITSTLTHAVLQEPGQPKLGPWNDFGGWFPDSTGFIVYDGDHPGEKAPYDRLIFLHIDQQHGILTRDVFDPQATPSLWKQYRWSPDATRLAVIVEGQENEIVILNREAVVLQKIRVNLQANDAFPEDIVWTNSGIICLIRQKELHYTDPLDFRMVEINPNDPGTASVELQLFKGYTYIESVDPFSPRLLIHRDYPGQPGGELVIFNMDTRQFEKTIFTHDGNWPYYHYLANGDSSVGAIMTNGSGNNLLFFYWDRQTLIDQKVRIEQLVQWRQDQQAFVVAKTNGAAKSVWWLETIRP